MEENTLNIVLCIVVIILIFIVARACAAARTEKFSLTRLSQDEGLPGPVGWYYPLRYRAA